jgi:hypothetical protein
MKSRALFVLGATLLTTTIAASAQAQGACVRLIVNIPFEFSVETKTLPAGLYSISCISRSSDQRVLSLRSENGNHTVLMQTMPVNGKLKGRARVIFRRYDEDAYFFASVWMPGSRLGFQSRKSRQERKFEGQVARMNRRLETVVLPAK